MASDPFTNADGTALSAHTAGGVTWGPVASGEAHGEINGNVVNSGSGFAVGGRATNSNANFSQIVFKAGTYAAESKAVHVRSSAASFGYTLMCLDEPTGDTFTQLALRRNDVYLTAANVSMNRLVDNTLAIRATTVGADVQIQAWLNGSPLTFINSLPDFEGDPSTTFTDPAAFTPIMSGNPGFSCGFFDGMNAANSAFDDWTDVEPGGPTSPEITSVSDTTLTHGQTGIVISGSGFSGSGNTVLICPTDNVDDALAVSQPITAQDVDEITLGALDLDSFAFGTLYLFVVNSSEEANATGEVISRVVASAMLNFTGDDFFFDENGDPVQMTGTLYVWRSARPPTSVGTPDQIVTGFATSAAGERSQPIALGSLEDGDTVFYVLFGDDGTDIYSAGEKLPDYA